MSQSRQLAAIMFTDISGYSSIMSKNTSKALEMIEVSLSIQKPLVKKHHGRWLKEMGDGGLAMFSTALDAVNCAIEIQASSKEKLGSKLRIGIHLGDVTVVSGDVYGDGVNVASRLESEANSGEIYISESVERAIRGQIELKTDYVGELKLKNISYGVRTYAVRPGKRNTSLVSKLSGPLAIKIFRVLLVVIFSYFIHKAISPVLIKSNISPVWADIFFSTVLTLSPSFIIVSIIPKSKILNSKIWRAVPLVNVIALIFILLFSFWGSELGAITEVISYENDGVKVSKTIVKGDFVKQIYVYPFSSVKPKLDTTTWLSKGIPKAMKLSLDQSQGIMTHYSDAEISLNEKLRPLEADGDFVINGTYGENSDTLIVTIDVFNKSGKQQSGVFHDINFTRLIDSIQAFLHKEIDPIKTDDLILPFNEFVTDNTDAFMHYTNGNFYEAYRLDPEFAYAYLETMSQSLLFRRKDLPDQKEVTDQVLKYMQKLPERDQLRIKRYYFESLGDFEKALEASHKYLKLNPADEKAIYDHTAFLITNEMYDEAFDYSYRKTVEKFRGGLGVALFEISLFLGKIEEIEGLVRKYDFLIPDQTSESAYGFIKLSEGKLPKAKQHFANALIEEPSLYSVDSMISVINYMAEVGDQKTKSFAQSVIGNYAAESLRTNISLFLMNNQIVAQYEDLEIPHTLYPINDSTLYRSQPYIYYTNQPEQLFIFHKAKTNKDLIIGMEHFRKNENQEEWEGPYYYYKESDPLKKAVNKFRQNELNIADSIFQLIFQQDSTNYYFIENYLQSIEYQVSNSSTNHLNDKEVWTFSNNSGPIIIQKHENHFLLKGAVGFLTFRLYPISDNELLNDFVKNETYKIVDTGTGMKLELYALDRDSWNYRLMESWLESEL